LLKQFAWILLLHIYDTFGAENLDWCYTELHTIYILLNVHKIIVSFPFM